MRVRHLIDRKPIVVERVNLEASFKPDARDLFLQHKAAQEAAAEEVADGGR